MEKHEKLRQLFYYYRVKGKIRNQKDFAKTIGVDEGSVSKAFQGNPTYLYNVIRKTLNAFTDINPDYLEGDSEVMLKSEAESVTPRNAITGEPIEAEDKPVEDVEEVQALPIVDIDLMKQRDINTFDYVDDNYDSLNKLRLGKVMERTTLVIQTYNDSMGQAIAPTDYLFVQKLGNPAHKIKEGDVYYIDTKSRGGIVRRCYYGSEPGIIEGRADNAQLYPTVLIPENDINDIGVIIGSFRFALPSASEAINFAKQLNAKDEHITTLLGQLDKAGERADKAGERHDKLLELLFTKLQ